ncbi:hypothetical protein MKZ38_001162 [Zalerion maritima]|uniref:RING-type domain-containing protein n=1 Tax=Zalerion maritima TaxID=339359 RepID=A0AAD5RQJ7_9PEZI|nr:hypothetical protein MKZ38_001162 [Zalerion maritima]
MAFSSLLGSGDRRRSSSRSAKSLNSAGQASVATPSASTSPLPPDNPPDYIADEAQLAAVDDDPPDLRELNNCLDALAVVFPNVQIEVFREMLSSFDGESRLFVVADALLKNQVSWVKGRWRVPDTVTGGGITIGGECEDEIPRPGPGTEPAVPRSETFRNPKYKIGVKDLAWQEFKGLSRSTIHAVLAENNYDYLSSRRELVRLSQKSWRFTISTLFLRRRTPAEEAKDTGALVNWRSTGRGSIEPTLKSTGNTELDRELFQAVVEPLRTEQRARALAADQELAVKLNNDEAEEANALFECACCYADVAFEELCSCSGQEGHNICFRCVQHCVSEAVFGQGWRSVDDAHGTLKCLAVDSSECSGLVPRDQLLRAVTSQKEGSGIMRRLDQRLADMSLASSGLPLVRCPFCDYAEMDDIYLPSARNTLRIKSQTLRVLVAFAMVLFAVMPLSVSLVVGLLFFLLHNMPLSPPSAVSPASPSHPQEAQEQPKLIFPSTVALELRASITRHLRRQRGLRFTCLSPACGRSSCLSCQKQWADIHVCNESALIKLRTKVEQEMSLAIKRVCPKCNTSFVKSSGCNKLTCPCGYKMCYVCRKDIGGWQEGYSHFCQHFRPEGDGSKCQSCDKCNLWQAEDTETVLARAKEKAEAEWRAREGRELDNTERRFLDASIPAAEGGFLGGLFASGNVPSLSEFCDMIIEGLFV